MARPSRKIIKDGKVVRTDHPNMRDVLADILDGTMTRKEIRDKRIDDAVNGVNTSKAVQDKLAGIKRRKA